MSATTNDRSHTKHNDLWFPDGDIILTAYREKHSSNTHSTRGHTSILFRVHKSIISNHCKVFKDIFGIPATKGVDQEIEGVPVVHLSDKASHLADFLGIIYGQRRYVTVFCRRIKDVLISFRKNIQSTPSGSEENNLSSARTPTCHPIGR